MQNMGKETGTGGKKVTEDKRKNKSMERTRGMKNAKKRSKKEGKRSEI